MTALWIILALALLLGAVFLLRRRAGAAESSSATPAGPCGAGPFSAGPCGAAPFGASPIGACPCVPSAAPALLPCGPGESFPLRYGLTLWGQPWTLTWCPGCRAWTAKSGATELALGRWGVGSYALCGKADGAHATYQKSAADWSCLGANTLDYEGPGAGDSWPPSLTVTPV